MKYEETQIRKVCGLYVNDWHLTTMTLPHIAKQVNENKKIITILENGIKSNIENILSKMNLNKETNNKILDINWTSNRTCKYREIKEQIQNEEEIEIMIKGTDKYIENANNIIQKAIKEIKLKKITIINLYEISECKNIDEIIKKHEYIINTSGIKKTSELLKVKDENSKNIV